jgi:transcriptional regulator with XRE-family HTH domain
MVNAYNPSMPRGRPSKSDRSDFGSRLKELRLSAGLSQQEVADQLGIGQPSYADWERRNVATTPEQLRRLADIFGVDIGDLFKQSGEAAKRGPTGRAKEIFTSISSMSRSRQKKVLDLVEVIVGTTASKP